MSFDARRTRGRVALRLDGANSSANAALAWVSSLRGDAGPALEQAERAIALNPNNPSGYLTKGHILVYSRRTAEARLAINTALRLDHEERLHDRHRFNSPSAFIPTRLCICGGNSKPDNPCLS